MVSAWPEVPSAKPAEPSAGACDGQEALAFDTSEPTELNHDLRWRADVVRPIPVDPPVRLGPPQVRISDIAN